MRTTTLIGAALFAATSAFAQNTNPAELITVTGEVLDLTCYVDNGKSGEAHAKCAATCIKSGLPVGLKAQDGKTYLLVGEHKPMNEELAQYAAKTITVRGKAVSRGGINMIENAEIQK
jgi:hypothetical protein